MPETNTSVAVIHYNTTPKLAVVYTQYMEAMSRRSLRYTVRTAETIKITHKKTMAYWQCQLPRPRPGQPIHSKYQECEHGKKPEGRLCLPSLPIPYFFPPAPSLSLRFFPFPSLHGCAVRRAQKIS